MRPYNIQNRSLLKSASFDGQTSYLDSMDGLFVTNNGKGVFSCWFQRQVGDVAIFCQAADNNNNLVLQIGVNNIFNYAYVDLRGTNNERLFFRSLKNIINSDNIWHHLLISWNSENFLTQNQIYIYLDDQNILDPSGIIRPVNNFISNLSVNHWRIGTAIPATSSKMKMNLAQYYLLLGQNLDLSIKNNRRKFISSNYKSLNIPNKINNIIPQLLLTFSDANNVGHNFGSAKNFQSFGIVKIN